MDKINNVFIYLFPFILPARQNWYVVFHPGNTSGTGVLADKRICSTQRILHRPWSRWRGPLPFYKTCTFLIFLTENNSWTNIICMSASSAICFKGQWLQGGNEHSTCPEAARCKAVICHGWGPSYTWWSHQWSGRTCCPVRTCNALV